MTRCIATAIALLAATHCVRAAESDTGVDAGKAQASNGVMKTLSGSVNWQNNPKVGPYGYGKFIAVMQFEGVVTNLNQLAKSQENCFLQGGWSGLSIWEERIVKDTWKERSYKFDGNLKGSAFSYTVSFSLSKKGVMTVMIRGTNRSYVDDMFNLSDVDSAGSSTIYYKLRLKTPSGTTILDQPYTVTVDYVNQAGKKSTAKKQKQ